MTKPIGIGIIGMGFMGQTHTRSFLADPSGAGSLVAVCDRDPDRRAGISSDAGNIGSDLSGGRLFDPDEVVGYEDPEALFADPRIDLVSICTHTDTHIELAIRALRAGKHVLVEKPVATQPEQIEQLIREAESAGRICVPAMCMRHWPGWSDLRTLIDSKEFGTVTHARFERLGAAPRWSHGFYADESKSGGAIFDLHIHDVDMVCWLFGTPRQVRSIGSSRHVATQYVFKNGPSVQTEGGWLIDPSFPFRMSFIVEFEHAVAAFDSAAPQPMIIYAEGEPHPVSLPSTTGYDQQATAVLHAISTGELSRLPTLEDALAVTRVIHAERRSVLDGVPVDLTD
ncbi:MAG: gfo/Idh/MocA family oxidoreductase [Planctomycetota bacterium]|nr:MAG: gfo/Idh/MocA family oxidoreductase [Planctomycetota bacterium]